MLAFNLVEAFVVTQSPGTMFYPNVNGDRLGRQETRLRDSEVDVDLTTSNQISNLFHRHSFFPSRTVDLPSEKTYGMPWTKSIDASLDEDALLFMPFWNWQMEFMKENLTNLRALPCENADGVDFLYEENVAKKARIVSLCYASDEYRKIRLTYYDAGNNCQVFNSVWYPSPQFNLPILGVDILSFNKKKFLGIVDFQPIHSQESKHALPYEARIKNIKDNYDSLKGRMSSKFYDETQFFSQQMLFARFEDEKTISSELFPAFKEYAAEHLKLIQECPYSPYSEMSMVLERQKAYDTYSAERDPAVGLFSSMFGKQWADSFVYNFLFSLAERGSPQDVGVSA
jgi:15,16-dihydrobiliverdin:ferredoxin oxidoreductase